MQLAMLKALNAARAKRQAVLLATDLRTGAQTLVREGEGEGSLGESYAKAFRQGKSVRLDTPQGDMFLNVFVPPPRLIVIGAVHIAQALYPMARAAAFDVSIIDPRTAFATPQRFGDVALCAEWPDEAIARIGIDRYTALAALTHDPKIDDPALVAALNTNCFYVGALGSRKTHAKRAARLADAGVTQEQIARIKAPIGLALGAVSPAEIAIAVLAEIIAALRLGAQEAA